MLSILWAPLFYYGIKLATWGYNMPVPQAQNEWLENVK